MSNPDEPRQIPAHYSDQTGTTGNGLGLGLQTDVISLQNPVGNGDLRLPLLNLSAVRARMDSLQHFLTESVHSNRLISKDQMDTVSSEIVSAIQQIIVNGAALLAYSQQPLAGNSSEPADLNPSTSSPVNGTITDQTRPVVEKAPEPSNPLIRIADPKVETEDEEIDGGGGEDDDCEIIELDAVELLAEHVHFCEICGKGFKRDANLRMHMRAHGNQFKTPEALAKPEKYAETRKTRFSCPFQGCNRNRSHKKFKALKSIICVRNHFKRSHCPKMYSCNRCNKKSFSVLADLKSHLKHCGETKWKCSCGTSFSRKDKLFGHMALFEGHMPAVMDDDEKSKGGVVPMEEDGNGYGAAVKRGELGEICSDNTFFGGLLDGFGAMEEYCLQDMLGSSPGLNAGIDEFYGL